MLSSSYPLLVYSVLSFPPLNEQFHGHTNPTRMFRMIGIIAIGGMRMNQYGKMSGIVGFQKVVHGTPLIAVFVGAKIGLPHGNGVGSDRTTPWSIKSHPGKLLLHGIAQCHGSIPLWCVVVVVVHVNVVWVSFFQCIRMLLCFFPLTGRTTTAFVIGHSNGTH